MKNIVSNQRGVALMLVLSAVVLLTTMLVEFAYNTNVNYHLALNERDRLKAYYLARSAYSFMLLELKFDQMFRKIVEGQNLSQYLGETAKLPLCQQFPISTGLIRTVFTGGGLEGLMGGSGEKGAEEGEEAKAEEDKIDDLRKDVSVSAEKTASEFLDFDGDFDAECADESTKISLNGFAGVSRTPEDESGVSPYDKYKSFLFKFLSKSEYELLFESADVKPDDAVNHIADWVDPDSEANTMDGRVSGSERTAYDSAGVGYKVRNGKLLTLLEAYLIDGVVDDWFGPLEDSFTVYGDGKINICSTEKDIVEGIIMRYVESTQGLPPLRSGNKDEMEKLVNAVTTACASGSSGDTLAQNIAAAVSSVLSGETREPQEESPETGANPAPAGGGSSGLASYITDARRFYTLKLAGQVADMTVRVKVVIDVKEADPKNWKLLYWRVY